VVNETARLELPERSSTAIRTTQHCADLQTAMVCGDRQRRRFFNLTRSSGQLLLRR